MARLLVALALLGAAFVNGVPTPSALPDPILGLFQSVPSKDVNFAEFAKVFNLPEGVSFEKGNTVGFRQEGDTYYQRFTFFPSSNTLELPFKLGETQTTIIQGKNVEYVYTLEGADSETPVLRGKFRETDGDVKFTVESTYNDYGANATYTRDNVVAKRTYQRIVPPYVLGSYQLVPSSLPPNFLEFFNNIYPLPKGVNWTTSAAFYIGREGDHYVEKFIPSINYYVKFEYVLNELKTIKWNNEDLEYKFTIKSSTPHTTTLVGEYKSSKGVFKTESVFTPEGVNNTFKTDKVEFKYYAKKVLPWLFYGTFEDVPEKTENWAEFMKGEEGCKIANATSSLTFFQKGEEYVVQKTINTPGNPTVVNWPFKPNTPAEIILPDGNLLKYNVTFDVRGDKYLLRIKTEIPATHKNFTIEEYVKPAGIYAVYKRGSVVGKKYYRRVVPKAVFGTFESAPDNEDFKAFAETVGAPQLLKKVTVEFTETPDHKVVHKITPEGEQPVENTFSWGEPGTTTIKGKSFKYYYFTFQHGTTPVVRAHYKEENNGPVKFDVAAVYTPEGYTATYSYNNRIATRTYTRKGPQVPLPTLPTV